MFLCTQLKQDILHTHTQTHITVLLLLSNKVNIYRTNNCIFAIAKINIDCLDNFLSMGITLRCRCFDEIVLCFSPQICKYLFSDKIYDATGIFYYIARDRHLPRNIYVTVYGPEEVRDRMRPERWTALI